MDRHHSGRHELQIPFDLRMPNTPLWIHFDEEWNILRVWRREEEGTAPG